jgi:heme exporter protein B
VKQLLRASLAVFSKDLRGELRTRYALNALFLFAVSTAVAVSLGIGPLGSRDEEQWLLVQAAFLWIALLFAALNGLSHSFVREEETRTALALRLAAPTIAIYLGKLLFNLLLLAALATVTTGLFVIFVHVHIGNIALFLALMVAGNLCLATTTTILAAIIARASFKGALFAVLSFPLLLPPLVVCIQATAVALGGGMWAEGGASLRALLAYAIVTFVASLLLFRFVWDA